jgi:hypothetical protein
MDPIKIGPEGIAGGEPEKSEYEQRLEAREARKAVLAAEKEEQKKRELLLLDDLEQEHGDDNVRPVWTVGGLVVIRCPKPPEMQRWREALWGTKNKQSENAASRANASMALAKACVIHPPREAYEALVKRYPGIPDLVAKHCVEFAGDTEEEEAGKS